MAENEEREVEDVLDEVDKLYDPSLDDLDTNTRIAHDVISESGSQNEVEDPPKRSRGQWRPGRDQRPQGKGKVADARPTSKSSV